MHIVVCKTLETYLTLDAITKRKKPKKKPVELLKQNAESSLLKPDKSMK